MDNNLKLINKVKNGFRTLRLDEKYKKSALKWLKIWLTELEFKNYKEQIAYLIEKEKWEFLLDSFYQIIPFGTGGRRGLVGIGPNRINTWTVQASAQGHSQYLIRHFGNAGKKRGIVLAYDVRKYTEKGIYNDKIANPIMNLSCKDLAIATAQVYAANNIKVFLFDYVRSTPELSFAIRYLDAVAGDMFSASHNPPTDNGKKVYNQFGGQLIPPNDENLVNEVTKNVKEIKKISFKKAKEKGLVKIVGKKIDDAFIKNICSLSLSKKRKIKIVYSPLHGTGLTSLYPALKKSGFNVLLDPKTSNLSSAFENVTFNIPNPEVIQSFDIPLIYAKKVNADLLINSDPDADRIGLMVKDKDDWHYFNGNEIGVILTKYGIEKYQAKKLINKNSTIIKTDVTTSLIEQIAKANQVNCIGDLLVGFKYIGALINKLEKQGKIKDFILGAEESHGFIMGNYVRDKDAAAAAIWLCELAAELKEKNSSLVNYLNKIYAKYGYCYNYLTEIRLPGANGMSQIAKIQNHLRKHKINSFGQFKVKTKIDRWQGEPQPHLSKTDTVSRNVLVFKFQNIKATQNLKVTIRPSGTEPKIKMYFEVFAKPTSLNNLNKEKKTIENLKLKLEKAFMGYCYKILDVDFPNRGFLLFWQLPLKDKMKYFEIEPEIEKLKKISNKKQRQQKLNKILLFLGSNPLEKINKAFKAKYKKIVQDYLNL